MVINFIKRKRIRKLRKVIRAMRIIAKSNDVYSSMRLANELSKIPIEESTNSFNFLCPDAIKSKIELNARQRFTITILEGRLFQELVLAIAFPEYVIRLGIPKKWRKALIVRGFNISENISKIKWVLLQGRFFLLSVYRVFNIVFLSFKEEQFFTNDRYAILEGVPSACISQDFIKNKDNFVSFFHEYFSDKYGIEKFWIRHSDNQAARMADDQICLSESIVPLTLNRSQLVYFFIEATALIIYGFLRFAAGKTTALITANEMIPVIYMKFVHDCNLPSWYLTTNSQIGYRALWTWYLESRNVKCGMVFYSVGNKPIFFRDKEKPSLYPTYEIMEWDRYFLWDKYHYEWICKAVKNKPKAYYLGPIPLSTNTRKKLSIPHDSISVFHVTPIREAYLATRGIVPVYYNEDTVIKFLSDVIDAVTSTGRKVVIKSKRNIGKLQGRKYTNFMNMIEHNNNVIIVDPEVSAERVINITSATISIPYTSTSVISKLNHKKSLYYDPTGRVENYNELAHNVKFISDKNSLTGWLAEID